MPHLKEGASIVNTTSINAYKGNASLIPYTATKGAEVGGRALQGHSGGECVCVAVRRVCRLPPCLQ
jgi:hypothetical protein